MLGSGAFWFETDSDYPLRCLRVAYKKILHIIKKKLHPYNKISIKKYSNNQSGTKENDKTGKNRLP